jgi:alpha-L-arabinofuranosidase
MAPASDQRLVRVTTHDNPSRRIYTGATLQLLSATATKDANGDVYLMVVNKDRTRTIRATVAMKGPSIGSAVIRRLVGRSFLSFNSAHHPQRVSIHGSSKVVGSRQMSLRLEPHSLTTVELRPASG